MHLWEEAEVLKGELCRAHGQSQGEGASRVRNPCSHLVLAILVASSTSHQLQTKTHGGQRVGQSSVFFVSMDNFINERKSI